LGRVGIRPGDPLLKIGERKSQTRGKEKGSDRIAGEEEGKNAGGGKKKRK